MTTKFILGIETSCDDTSIAILEVNPLDRDSIPTILSFNLFSQETLLAKWGGIVPEIAARNHLEKIVPLLDQTLTEAKLSPSDIDLIGVTTNPGLLGPLLTGLNAAKSLSLIHEIPIVGVNHLYAHLEAIHLSKQQSYPYLGLLVSGGHSLYLLVSSSNEFEIIGTTLDDAAGEAFDKGGKILGLGYPAGRIIDDLAKTGDPLKFEFPVGLKNSANSNLSYSGVKTSMRQFLAKNPQYDCEGKLPEDYHCEIADVCASYQHAIVTALKLKLKYALKFAKEKTGKTLPIVVGGGVACNSYLRMILQKHYKDVSFVEPKFCTDNGAMVANYANRIQENAVSFPDCLTLDAKGRFISKEDNLLKSRAQKNKKNNEQRELARANNK